MNQEPALPSFEDVVADRVALAFGKEAISRIVAEAQADFANAKAGVLQSRVDALTAVASAAPAEAA